MNVSFCNLCKLALWLCSLSFLLLMNVYSSKMATTKANSASPSTSVSELVTTSGLRVIEYLVRMICLRIDEYGIKALLKTVLMFVALFAVKKHLQRMSDYECPEENYYFYGNLFIYGPAVVFLCFAFVFSRPFWEFVTCCCRLHCNKQLLVSPRSAIDIYLAISSPFLWVACALIEKDYYVCAYYGPNRSYRGWQTTPDSVRWVRNAERRSQVLAWAIILSWALTSAVVVSLHRCCNTNKEAKSKVHMV